MTVVDQALEELQRLLSGANIDPDLVGPALGDLAGALRLTPPGELRLPLGARPRLALDPNPLTLPLISTPARDVRIDAKVDWSFAEAGVPVRRRDISATSLSDGVVEPLIRPKVVTLHRASGRPRADAVRRIVPKAVVELSIALEDPPPITSGPVAIPPEGVPAPTLLLIAPVQVPRLLALFRHKGFSASRPTLGAGWALVLVSRPAGLDDPAELQSRLGEVAAVAGELTAAFGDLPAVVGHLGVLAGHLGAFSADRIRVLVDSSVPALADVGIPFDGAKLEAGNAASSLIFVGLDDASVECWSGAHDFAEKRFARFTVRAGSGGVAMLPDLHSDVPQATPSTASVKVHKKPGAANTFGDALSAIRFVPPGEPLA